MKKLIFLLIALVTAAVAIAQERVVSVTMPTSNTYIKYTGTASDVLVTSTKDTIDVVFQYQGPGFVKKIALKSRFDMNSTADTTVLVSVFGKEFYDDGTYVQVIASTASAEITSNNVVQVLANDYTETIASHTEVTTQSTPTIAAYTALLSQGLSANMDTLSVPQQTITLVAQTNTVAAQTTTPFDKSYRYFRVRYILAGDNTATGTGVKLDEIELKLYTED